MPFVDEVIARIVGASQRDARTLSRIAMSVDNERRSWVLLQRQRYFIETGLVLVRDSRRVEREDDRPARFDDFGRARFRRYWLHGYHKRAAAAGAWPIAASCVGRNRRA